MTQQTAQLDAVQQAGSPAAASDGLPLTMQEPEGLTGLKLPAPSELLPNLPASIRLSSFEQENLVKPGEGFNPQLPSNRISAAAAGLTYSPDWFPGDGLDGLSYAMYSFTLPDYAGAAKLRYSWITAPTNPERIFVGFANWDIDRWSWHQGSAEGLIDAGSFDGMFVGGGNMLVCFLLTGESAAVLDTLRIGSLMPQVSLSADRPADLVPCEFLITAEASDPDGSIAEYLWDPEGDGSFDVSTGTEPQFTLSCTTAGRHAVGVRVVDDGGIGADAQLSLSAYAAGGLNFGRAGGFDVGDDIVVGQEGQLLIFGHANQKLLFTGLQPQGELQFAILCEDSGNDVLLPLACTLAPDGFVYVTSYAHNGPVIQKWTQEGSNIWSKILPSPNPGFDSFPAICALSDGNIIWAGKREELIGNTTAVIVCLTPDGDVIWKKELASPADHASIVEIESFAGAGADEVRICGNYFNNSPDMLYASLDGAGNLLDCQIWESDSFDELAATMTSLPNGDVFIAGFMPAFGLEIAVISKVGGDMLLIRDDDDLDLRSVDLLRLSEDMFQIILVRDESTSVVGYVNSLLSVLSMELMVSSGEYLLNESSVLGTNGQLLIGSALGSTPSPSVYEASTAVENGLGQWIELDANFVDGDIALEDLDVTTTEASEQITFGNDASSNHALVIRSVPEL